MKEQDLPALISLYESERAMGRTLHQTTTSTAVVILTYFGLIIGLVLTKNVLPLTLTLFLPAPALALMLNFILQFGMVAAHGASIDILEARLVNAANLTAQRASIGARAEERHTNIAMLSYSWRCLPTSIPHCITIVTPYLVIVVGVIVFYFMSLGRAFSEHPESRVLVVVVICIYALLLLSGILSLLQVPAQLTRRVPEQEVVEP